MEIANSYPFFFNETQIIIGKLGQKHIDLAYSLKIDLDESYMAGRFNEKDYYIYGDKEINNPLIYKLLRS